GCRQRRVYGITAPASEGLLGGWSEQIEILPGVRLVPLPENLSAEDFLGGGCSLPTGFHAGERAGVGMGGDAVKARLDAARRLGAEDTLDITEVTNPEKRAAWVRQRTSGRGADVVIEA